MKKYIIMFLVSTLLLSGCQPAARSFSDAAVPQSAPSEGYYSARSYNESTSESGYATSASTERVVIKNARLEIVVEDPVFAVDSISHMAEEMGGFVVESSIYKTYLSRGGQVPEGSITVRVPADRLTEAMDQVKALVGDPGKDIITENVTGQDVTLEYTDLKSRLRNQEDAAQALRELLLEARDTEHVLQVFQELNRVTEQIELLKGQIRYYDESVRLSAISVRLQSQEAVVSISVAGWNPTGVARNALQTLIDVLQFLVDASIWVVIVCIPISILFLVPLYFILRTFRRYRSRRKAIANPAEE
jgi:hypothetical protein